MEDQLKKIEEQVVAWEKDLTAKLDDNWTQKRVELEQRIAKVREGGAEQWKLLKTGVEVAWEDLRQTYEAMEAARGRQGPPAPGSNSGVASPKP